MFTEDRKRDAALLQCGKAFVTEAAAAKDAFVLHRLPVETLHATVADFERAMSKAVASRADQANAKKAVDEARAECLKLLQRVDAVVANTLADDPTLTAEWKLRRRIGQRVERVLEEPPQEAAIEASS